MLRPVFNNACALARCGSVISLSGSPVRARGVKRNSNRESSSNLNVALDFCSALSSSRKAVAASPIARAAALGALLSAAGATMAARRVRSTRYALRGMHFSPDLADDITSNERHATTPLDSSSFAAQSLSTMSPVPDLEAGTLDRLSHLAQF